MYDVTVKAYYMQCRIKGNLSKSVQYKGKLLGAQKLYSYMKWFGTWHNQSKTWEHGKASSGSNH